MIPLSLLLTKTFQVVEDALSLNMGKVSVWLVYSKSVENGINPFCIQKKVKIIEL